MKLLEGLNWRYATKKFDSDRKISEGKLLQIKEAIRLTPTSYGLQLFKVLIIEDPDLRKKLRIASYDQSQITDASHLVVFCNYLVVDDKVVDDYMALKARSEEKNIDDFKGYADFIKQDFSNRTEEEKSIYTAKQTYLALSSLLNACAELKVDACPMEGFEPEKYNETLGLSERGLNAAVITTIGYRSAEDRSQYAKKVRKPEGDIFELI
ncbi:MAG: NAD(P)H-dependent oxidoreductase [Roseivirga sp.]|nr:NAD(P)H-dependent oxidoreductase [Roseivirga sp.]